MKHTVAILSIASAIALVIVGQSQSPDASQGSIELLDRVSLKKHAPHRNFPSNTIETNSTISNDEAESNQFRDFDNTAVDESVGSADQQKHAENEYRIVRSGEQSINDWVEELAANNAIAEKVYKNTDGDKVNSITTDKAKTSGARVMHVEISGNETVTTVGGVVTRSVNTDYNSAAERGVGSAMVSNDKAPQAMENVAPVSQEQGYDAVVDEVTYNTDGEQVKNELSCPDSLYGGGNAYAVNMLKKRGCPKPAYYTGPW